MPFGKCLLLGIFTFAFCQCTLIPLRMPKCKSTDTKCLCRAATLGFKILKSPNRALRLPSIDPFVVDRIHVPANTKSHVSFTQDYYYMEFRGMSLGIANNCSVTMNATHLRFKFDLFMEHFEMISWYKWVGIVMGYPIDGFGRNNITSERVTHSHNLAFAIGKNKKLILREHRVDLRPDNLHFNAENLVNDNPDASARAMRLFNSYSTPIFKAVKKDYDNTFSKCFLPYICAFFKHIRLDDLFLDAA